MVLQSNFAKRSTSNAENTPPFLHGGKSLVSRIRSSLHDAARRRRARTNGTARTPKYVVEQARRRTHSRSHGNTIRFNVTTIKAPKVIDSVEIKDVEPSFSTTTVPIMLPRELGRPEYCDISQEAIVAVDPDLNGTDISYLREGLEEFGPGMLQVLSSVKGNPIKDVLPKELSIIVHDLSSAVPSHMLAIYGPPSKNGSTEKRKVTLYPAHSLVFAAYCSKLPPFPSPPVPTASQPGEPLELTVPIRPLCLPSPQTYPRLSSFLYTKRTDVLLQSLMPCPPPSSLMQSEGEDSSSQSSQLVEFAAKLAGTYTTQALLQHTMTVHGLWQNTCALGIFDDSLWETIDLAWQILLTAIAIGTGNPRDMIVPSAISSSLEQPQPCDTLLQSSPATSQTAS